MIHIIGVSLCIRRCFNSLKMPSHWIISPFSVSIHQGGKVGFSNFCPAGFFCRFRRSGAETVLSNSCTLGDSSIDAAIGVQIHLAAKVREEQTAFHCPVTTLHDKTTGSYIIQKKRKTTFNGVIVGVIAIKKNSININTLPFLAGSLGMCLCL